MNASKPKAHSNGPIMSGQIMIQSEQELLLMKQVNIIAICLNQNFIVQLQNDEKKYTIPFICVEIFLLKSPSYVYKSNRFAGRKRK